MTKELVDQKMTQLKQELEQAETELAKLKPRVQYLEMIVQRCDGALSVLQSILNEAAAPPVIATPANHAAVPQEA